MWGVFDVAKALKCFFLSLLVLLLLVVGVSAKTTVLNLTNYCSINQYPLFNGTFNETDPIFNNRSAVNITAAHVSFLDSIHYDWDSVLRIVWMHWVIP